MFLCTTSYIIFSVALVSHNAVKETVSIYELENSSQEDIWG